MSHAYFKIYQFSLHWNGHSVIVSYITTRKNIVWQLSGITFISYVPSYKDYRSLVYTSLSPIRRGFAPGFVNYKKGALDSQPQVIKFTSCLRMVGGSLRVLRFPPPLKLVAMIYLKYCWNQINQCKKSLKMPKGVIRIRTLKNRQHNCQRKSTKGQTTI